MQKRVITPYPDAPDLSVYEDEDLDSAFSPKPEAELDHSCREILLKKAKMKAKKKPRRRSDSSGGYTLSDIIQSPPAAVVTPYLVKSGKANSTESLQELLTSDSEGSYMGVGSPRDMQSPVFHDRAEDEKAFSQRLKTPPSTPTSLRDCLLTPPNSAPQTIPKVLPCPARAPPVLDLRTIMDMEANSLQTLGATPKSPGSVSTSVKHSPITTKLSQKQRKLLAMANKEASVESTASKPAPTVTPSKSSGKACSPVPTLLMLISSATRGGGELLDQSGANRSPQGPKCPGVPCHCYSCSPEGDVQMCRKQRTRETYWAMGAGSGGQPSPLLPGDLCLHCRGREAAGSGTDPQP